MTENNNFTNYGKSVADHIEIGKPKSVAGLEKEKVVIKRLRPIK